MSSTNRRQDCHHSATFALYVLLPLSRFFRPSAPIMGDKTNRKSRYYMCWGNKGKVITQSWNLLSGFHKSLSLQAYHHPGRSHPLPSTLAGETDDVQLASWPEQPFLPTAVHVILLAAKKAANNQHQYAGDSICQKQKLRCSPYGQILGRCRGPGVLWLGWHSFYTQR